MFSSTASYLATDIWVLMYSPSFLQTTQLLGVSVPSLYFSLEPLPSSMGYSSGPDVPLHCESVLSPHFQSLLWPLVLTFPYSMWNVSSHRLDSEGPQPFRAWP